MQQKKDFDWGSVVLYSLLTIVLSVWGGVVWLAMLNMSSP